MSGQANSENISAAGLVKFDGTATYTGVTTTQFCVQVGAASNGLNSITNGTTGQVLQATTSNNPTWSTAAYPATAGTSGNVLTSNGTDWTSASSPGGGLLSASGTLTSSQIKNLHATPITAIAAPGSGKTIVITNASSKLNYGGTNAFVAGASQTIKLYYNSTTSATLQIATNTQITSTQNYSDIGSTPGNVSGASTNFSNQPITLYNDVATEISGNAANNNTLDWNIQYYIINY